jgi:hypothetical protein
MAHFEVEEGNYFLVQLAFANCEYVHFLYFKKILYPKVNKMELEATNSFKNTFLKLIHT